MINRCQRCQKIVKYKYCPSCCEVLGINYNDLTSKLVRICHHCGTEFKHQKNKPTDLCLACRALRAWRTRNKLSGKFWAAFYELYDHGKRFGTLNKAIEQMDQMIMDKSK